jgi:cytochrome oxidase Cu insertion factor (SCO1/SenC/PrrC family)/copper(I)-binding protein
MRARGLSIVALCVAAACAREQPAPAFRGVALSAPIRKPAFTLTDFNGRPFDFVAETRDRVALLFFGYTHCPDVCPLHMANIAAVLRQMPAEERARVVTVFVTTDPDRDTPERLRTWLANFDPSFVGLTGTNDEIVAVQQAFNLQPAFREYAGTDSANYFVGHAAQVFAFARDGVAYTIYPFGIRQDDWANDLPRLVRDPTGAEIRRTIAAQAAASRVDFSTEPADSVTMGGLYVSQALVAEPASQDEAAAYLTIRNDTPQADTIVAIAADLAVRGEVHETMGEGQMRHMMAVPSLALPPRSETRLMPGGTHVMLHQLRRSLRAGDTVTLYLSLARAGALEVRAAVVPYADLEKALAPTGNPR